MARTFGKYVATERLGAGGQATAWLAHHVNQPDEQLLLKTFHVAVADDWKTAELFERAAATLERLNHPQIPTYRDHFEVEDKPGEVLFCLVREFAPGESLQERIDSGGSYDEFEVIDIALGLLDVLEYLHAQDPPVIHRDIKPANVVMSPDGVPRLVDFGAVQAEVLDETGGSTIVGTAGYVAPEQLMGRAQPASDIYALGVTLVHLISGVAPIDLPSDGFELDVSSILETSRGLAYIVGRMTRADIDMREHSIPRLREQFGRLAAGDAIVVRSTTLPVKVPIGSKLEVFDKGSALMVCRPIRKRWDELSRVPLMDVVTENVPAAVLTIGMAFVLLGIFIELPIGIVGGILTLTMLGVFASLYIIGLSSAAVLEDDGLRFNWRGAGAMKFHAERIHPSAAIKVYRNMNIAWEDLKSVKVDWGPDFARIGLELDVETARLPTENTELEGRLFVDLGLTRGEYIWLKRLIDARLAQFRELN